MIPKQLQNKEFRFVLLKTKTKIPFEKDWQNNGYKWDDEKLQSWIKVGGNYGVIGGYGNLRILDIDKKEFAQNFEVMLDTFTIETGSGGKHFYFLSDYDQNHVLIEEIGELRANNYQCVGAGSTHPNGKKYKVYIDKELKQISKGDLLKNLKPFLRDEVQTNDLKIEGKDTSGSGLEFRRVLAMIREKKSRKIIYKEMGNYRKWASSGDDYKNLTYNKAHDIFLKEKEPKEQKPKVEEKKLSKEEIEKIIKESYHKIVEILKKYMDLNEENYSLIAVWILGTHFHKEFSTYPYLYFNAMKGSGKSRVLNLIKTLSKNGRMLNSITEAVLFRTRGALCIDEFESIGRIGKENLRELLNSAYKKGVKVIRFRKVKGIDGENQEEEEFDVYRPVAMANIWGMENVLSDRCIKLILEKSNNVVITKLIEDFEENDKIQNIVSVLKGISYTTDTYTSLFEDTKKKWNIFILENQHTNNKNQQQVSVVYSVDSVSSVSNNNDLFNKINGSKLSGRDLELFFPLYLIADICGILDEILETSQKIVKERKEGDMEENNDIQFIEFISNYIDTDFISVTRLTNQFKESIGSEDKWINASWTGRALRRLALIKEKRNTGRVRQVKLDVEKAKEKIRIFK